MVSASQKSVLEYGRDVQRLIAVVQLERSSYDANLDAQIGLPRYHVVPVATPLGDGTLRVLGRNDAVFESTMTIYRVAYQVHAFVKQNDAGSWEIDSRIRVLMRHDRVFRWDDSRAARNRFVKVVLPVLAGVLDTPEMATAREAAQASRLAWEIADHDRDVRRLDELIAELRAVRTAKAATMAADRREIAQISVQLAATVDEAAKAA